MRHKLPRRSLRSAALCIAVSSMAGCAVAPAGQGIDGGIVGTGNRIDCEALAKEDKAPAEMPEACKLLPGTGN